MTYEMALLERELAGELRGEQRGRKEERESVALNMLRSGMSTEKIEEFTKLSIERIKELAKNIGDIQMPTIDAK